jgi:hypothetical protein
MDVGGIVGKLESNADKLGMVVGSASLLSQLGSGDIFKGVQIMTSALMTNPHIPDFAALFGNLTGNASPESKLLMQGVGAAIVGYLMKEINIHPTVTRIGNFLTKAGIGLAEADLVFTGLEYAGQY